MTESLAYITVQHPNAGDVYACEVRGNGLRWTKLLRASGPLHHSEPRDPASIKAYLSNQDATENSLTAQWLEKELDRE